VPDLHTVAYIEASNLKSAIAKPHSMHPPRTPLQNNIPPSEKWLWQPGMPQVIEIVADLP